MIVLGSNHHPENVPIDLPADSTPTAHMQSIAGPCITSHVMSDDSLISLGNEIALVGYVVGPMPAEELLESLPPTSKSSSAEEKPFTNLADKETESQMYDPFVRIPFCLIYSY